jgi:argininosuccinate lyase
VIWSSSEFGFCEPAEEFSSGSSIMPQKKNPDAAELLRAKAPRITAAFSSVSGALHALPMAYSKDMQEDKEPLFDAVDNVELSLEVAAGLLTGLSFSKARLADAASDEMIAAVDLADLLVRKGVPFREAHGVVGALVREAVDRGVSLSELPPDVVEQHAPDLGEGLQEVLAGAGWLESKISAGGTASARLTEQLAAARKELELHARS